MNKEHESILKTGVMSWNSWRYENPHIKPDLEFLDIRSTDLRGVDLSNAKINKGIFKYGKLTGSNFRGASLKEAEFSLSIANDSDFSNANLCKSNLFFSDLRNSNLNKANLNGANLRACKLCSSNLEFCDLRDANLIQVDFSDASLSNALFSSRSQLAELDIPLTDTQIGSIVFEDEQSSSKKEFGNDEKEESIFRLKLSGNYISPFNLSYLLLAIEGTYNNIFYLSTTNELELIKIQKHLVPFFQGVGASDSIVIKEITKGSIIVDFATYSAGVAGVLLTLAKTMQIIGSEVREYRSSKQDELDREVSRKKIEAESENINAMTTKMNMENNKLYFDISSDICDREFKDFHNEIDFHDISLSDNTDNECVINNQKELLRLSSISLAKVIYKLNRMGYEVNVKSVREN